MSRSIGLDIGHHAVRAVACELVKTGWRMVAHASVPRQDAAGDPRPLAAVLAELDSRVSLTKGTVSVADSARNLLVRYLPTVPLPPDRLVKLLRLELAQHVGEAGELAADIYEVPLAGEEVIHGAVMAQPEQIRDLLADCKRVGVTPKRIHVGAAALANATLATPLARDEELVLLVDIGAASTHIALVGDNGRLLAFRQLALGGSAFTQALADGRGLSAAQAEQQKIAAVLGARAAVVSQVAASAPTVLDEAGEDDELIVILLDGLGATDADPSGELADDLRHVAEDARAKEVLPGFLDEPEPELTPPAVVPAAAPARSSQHLAFMEEDSVGEPGFQTVEMGGAVLGPEMTRVAEQLYGQLSSTITWFKAQLQNGSIAPDRIALCGGGAALIGLEAYLARRFKLPVDRYDPCTGIDGAVPQPGHDYALALGLALSEDRLGVRLNLLPEGDVMRRAWRDRLIWPYIAAAVLLIAASLFGYALLRTQWRHANSLANLAEYRSKHEALTADLKSLADDRAALNDDLRTIASGIHFNRDLLYVVRMLKEQAPENQELWVTRLETVPPELERAAPGRRPTLGGGGTRAPTVALESALDRGAVEIEGRVKFDLQRRLDAEQTNRFFNDYMKALDVARAGSSRQPLFDPAQTKVFLHWLHEEESAPRPGETRTGPRRRVADGSFPFGVRFVFRPTDLRQATAAVTSDVHPVDASADPSGDTPADVPAARAPAVERAL